MVPSDEMLCGLLAAAPDALLAVDVEGRIAFVSDQAERLFRWPKEDLLGRAIECLVPERFSLRHPSLRGSYSAHPTTRPMGAGLDLRARRRDGTEFPAEISLSSFTTTEGTLVAAAVRDVTDTRRTEQHFRAVLASAPDAIVGVNASGRIDLVNSQAERLFGWTAAELLGRTVETLVPEAVVDRHVRHRAAYADDPGPRPMGAALRLSARRKDGSTFPTEISLSAVTDEFGEVGLVLAAVRDASERLELEAERQHQALAAQREQSHRLESLGQLAGGVAHDFNNLLGVILNYTTLLGRRITDPTQGEDLGEIRAAAERAAALTRQLLTFARRDVVHPEPLEVNNIVRGVASMLERTLGESIELRLDLATGPLTAVGDRHQLEQIVLNLAINARDAMPSGGTLTIATSLAPGPEEAEDAPGRHRSDVVLRVIDTGHGMPPEVVTRAFEPFFTTKPRGRGTGLGLATVYGIVQQHGGQVTIESAIGEGTTITVVLQRASPAAPKATSRVESSAGGHGRILLVEDEGALRVGMARLLAARGYEVLVAAAGDEALEVFDREAGAIDAVVTDVVMPRMRGDELARRLEHRRPAVPVIFMSGYDSGDRSVMAGPRRRLLAKPVAEEALLLAIREAVDG